MTIIFFRAVSQYDKTTRYFNVSFIEIASNVRKAVYFNHCRKDKEVDNLSYIMQILIVFASIKKNS